jgi:hypothetical protein
MEPRRVEEPGRAKRTKRGQEEPGAKSEEPGGAMKEEPGRAIMLPSANTIETIFIGVPIVIADYDSQAA